jgi:single-strand DNA-binding protein
MAGINKVILVGHLGKDPEVRTIESGAKVARFSLATTEAYKDKNGERKEITEWHTVICWRNQADIAEKYLTKGKLVYIEGKLRTRTWDDNTGTKRYTTEVYADNFIMLGAKTEGSSFPPMPTAEPERTSAATATAQVQTPMEKEDDGGLPPFINEEDDLPF